MRKYSTRELTAVADRAPKVVQDTVNSEQTTSTVADIGIHHKLHIDQIGALAELNMQLLLGLINPSQFLGELLIIGISQLEARQIMGEINEKIFKPLQAEMRRSGGGAATALAQPASHEVEHSAAPPPSKYGPLPPLPIPPQNPITPLITHRPILPPPPWSPAPQTPRPSLPPQPVPLPPRAVSPGEPPPNLPTGTAPQGVPVAAVPKPTSNEFSPLAKQPTTVLPPLSSGSTPETPPVRYSADPYREPIDEPPA